MQYLTVGTQLIELQVPPHLLNLSITNSRENSDNRYFTEKHKEAKVTLPARKPPISYVHHSTHSMTMLGMAKWMYEPQSCRHSLDQPVWSISELINHSFLLSHSYPSVLGFLK